MSHSVVTLALQTMLEVRQLFFRGQSFFPAVTVVFRARCLACLEDFSVVFLNYGL